MGSIPKQESGNANTSPDQAKETLGIRDLPGRKEEEEGKFIETQQETNHRRDPEESRYNEAGQLPFIKEKQKGEKHENKKFS